MNFLSDFVMIALVLQVATLALGGIFMGSQAVHRTVSGFWARHTGGPMSSGH